MKICFCVLFLSLSLSAYSQLQRFGGGLLFSSGVEFNNGETGNPGLFGQAYIKIADRMNLVPSLSVYNRYKKKTTTEELKNYMFQTDLNVQYGIFRQDQLRISVIGGLNFTGLISRYEKIVEVGQQGLDNRSEMRLGANAGAVLEMFINDYYDAVFSARYIAGEWDQVVISLGVVYFLDRQYRRKSW